MASSNEVLRINHVERQSKAIAPLSLLRVMARGGGVNASEGGSKTGERMVLAEPPKSQDYLSQSAHFQHFAEIDLRGAKNTGLTEDDCAVPGVSANIQAS
jgi:hypothetical protein